jgi:hypothetical protein
MSIFARHSKRDDIKGRGEVSRTCIVCGVNEQCILFWARICRWDYDIKAGLLVRDVRQWTGFRWRESSECGCYPWLVEGAEFLAQTSDCHPSRISVQFKVWCSYWMLWDVASRVIIMTDVCQLYKPCVWEYGVLCSCFVLNCALTLITRDTQYMTRNLNLPQHIVTCPVRVIKTA